ncbi:hypothetical protein SDC9_122052 [bioreactor metagenome]|uniref:Uncharacterized protein n=1 Tax=bioreactor metagenome TaxID=1076179 RepID=A0A645CDS3_9ZZZZ
MGERTLHVLLGVERQHRLVLGVAVQRRVLGVALLEVGRVPQDDLGECRRALGRPDVPGEPVLDQPRQVAAVVHVGVGEHHVVDVGRIHREGGPVHRAPVLLALVHPRVDEDAPPADGEEELRAGHGAGRAEEGEGRGSHGSTLDPAVAARHRLRKNGLRRHLTDGQSVVR